MKRKIRLTESDLHRIVNASVKRVLREDVNTHMGIDDICNLLGGGEKGYNTLNMILWSLQEQGAVEFHEDVLDELYNSPNY